MKDDERLDLSALDPARNRPRWDAIMQQTLARVDSGLRARASDPLSVIESWTRPLLAAAAVGVMAVATVEVLLEAGEERRERVERLVTLSSGWSPGAGAPPGIEFVRALTAARDP